MIDAKPESCLPETAAPIDPAESPEQRAARLARARFSRWYAKHKDELRDRRNSVRNQTLSNAPATDAIHRQAVATLRRMGFDPDEVVRVNELERQVGEVKRWVSDLSSAQRKTEQRLNGPAAPAWGIGDRVLVPAPITQARNRQNLSTVLTVLAFGEVVSMNAVRREATVRISPDQAVSVRFEDVMAVRAKPRPPVTGKR